MESDINMTMYTPLDPVFGILFNLSGDTKFNMLLGVSLMSLLVSIIIMLVTSKVTDQKQMKRMREKMKKQQEKMKAAQKKNDTKQVNKISKDMMTMQTQMMSNSMKPMLYTFVPIIIIFGWLRQYPPLQDFVVLQGYLVALPFALPHWGSQLGWLGWYIMCSFPASSIIRKVLKMDIM